MAIHFQSTWPLSVRAPKLCNIVYVKDFLSFVQPKPRTPRSGRLIIPRTSRLEDIICFRYFVWVRQSVDTDCVKSILLFRVTKTCAQKWEVSGRRKYTDNFGFSVLIIIRTVLSCKKFPIFDMWLQLWIILNRYHTVRVHWMPYPHEMTKSWNPSYTIPLSKSIIKKFDLSSKNILQG